MSIFDSKKVAWRKKVQTSTKSKTAFEELERLYGSPLAKEFVELIHTKAHEQNNTGILDTTPAISDIIPLLMTVEKNSVLKRRGFYQGYMTDAKSGNLGIQLNADISPVNDYYKNPGTRGATGRELAIDQAANWICGTYVAALPSTRALLSEYIPANSAAHGKFGPCLGKTSAELWKVHKRLVPGLPSQTRLSTKMTPTYPSTVGAGFLFDELFTMVTGQHVWPPFGDAHWDSIAAFYLGSIGTIQVFPDGNKRMSRFAYSVLLIKGTHAFKAPTDTFCMGLYRMKG